MRAGSRPRDARLRARHAAGLRVVATPVAEETSGVELARRPSCSDPPPPPPDEPQSGEGSVDTLKSAGRTSSPGLARDPLDRAEGFRYLSRLTRAALETFVEHADPLAPVLHRPVHETAKIGADNPDNTTSTRPSAGARVPHHGDARTIHYLDLRRQSSGVASSGKSRRMPSQRRRSRDDRTSASRSGSAASRKGTARDDARHHGADRAQTYLDRDPERPLSFASKGLACEGGRRAHAGALDAGFRHASVPWWCWPALFLNWPRASRSTPTSSRSSRRDLHGRRATRTSATTTATGSSDPKVRC